MCELLLLLSLPIQINICYCNQLAADGFCHKWDLTETRVPGCTTLERRVHQGPHPATVTSVSVYILEYVYICTPYNGCSWKIIWLLKALCVLSVQNSPPYSWATSPNLTQPPPLNSSDVINRSQAVKSHTLWWPSWSFVIAVRIRGRVTQHLTAGRDEQILSPIIMCHKAQEQEASETESWFSFAEWLSFV